MVTLFLAMFSSFAFLVTHGKGHTHATTACLQSYLLCATFGASVNCLISQQLGGTSIFQRQMLSMEEAYCLTPYRGCWLSWDSPQGISNLRLFHPTCKSYRPQWGPCHSHYMETYYPVSQKEYQDCHMAVLPSEGSAYRPSHEPCPCSP